MCWFTFNLISCVVFYDVLYVCMYSPCCVRRCVCVYFCMFALVCESTYDEFVDARDGGGVGEETCGD